MKAIKTVSPMSNDLTWEISEVAGHFHITCVDPESGYAGSGFGQIKETAKKIAASELNERYLVSQLKSPPSDPRAWALDFDGSCSGFAVGYSQTKATLRALCEGLERWALSKWVDDAYPFTKHENLENLSLSTYFRSRFTECTAYQRQFPLLIDARILNIYVAVVLAWTPRGVFAGYGTKPSLDEALDHASVEVLRNFVIHQNQPARAQFPYDRITFFANNAQATRDSIKSDPSKKWRQPVFKFLKAEAFGDLWLARAICEDWTPWQEGPVSRFLY